MPFCKKKRYLYVKLTPTFSDAYGGIFYSEVLIALRLPGGHWIISFFLKKAIEFVEFYAILENKHSNGAR